MKRDKTLADTSQRRREFRNNPQLYLNPELPTKISETVEERRKRRSREGLARIKLEVES